MLQKAWEIENEHSYLDVCMYVYTDNIQLWLSNNTGLFLSRKIVQVDTNSSHFSQKCYQQLEKIAELFLLSLQSI